MRFVRVRGTLTGGGIDIQLLGSGDRHIAFNEPGVPSTARRGGRAGSSYKGSAASDFFGEENVPVKRSRWVSAPFSRHEK